jgi:alkylhydroperoxidase/carboxymuconolactone decarboxylase family protein YurZ
MGLTSRQEELKAEFIKYDGWSDAWETLLTIDPDYFAAWLKLRAPARKNLLPLKIQELLLLAVSASCVHLYAPGIRAHTVSALAAGATKEEILEILILIPAIAVHSITVGVPLLLEVLEENGNREVGQKFAALDAKREKVKAEFTAKRGYWHEVWDPVLELDPDALDGYMHFSGEGWRKERSVLSPMVKELAYVAVDAATTHLYQVGLKLHIANAIKYGASAEVVMQVLDLAALMGVHTNLVASPIVAEELKKHSQN